MVWRIGDHPRGLTKEQTTETMDPGPKTKGLRLYPRQWNLELVGPARLPRFEGVCRNILNVKLNNLFSTMCFTVMFVSVQFVCYHLTLLSNGLTFCIHSIFCHFLHLLTSVFTTLLNAPSYFYYVRERFYHGWKLPSRFASSKMSR